MTEPRQLETRAGRLSPRALRIEVLAAMVVGITLIPEAISFSVIAHADTRVGLYFDRGWTSGHSDRHGEGGELQ